MLTETWDLDFAPVLPPRWDPKASRLVRMVYLDQWCYRSLAADRAGKPENDSEAGCYEYLRQLALSGKVVFLLSQAHYAETWSDGNADRRWDMAVAMAELTGFNTINISDLVTWDALEGVSAYMGVDAEIPTPPLFGWGLAHCLTGTEQSQRIIDTRTGRPATWEGLPEATRLDIERLDQRLAEQFELATLARRDPRMEPHLLMPFAPVPGSGYGDRLIREEEDIIAAIDELGRNESNVRVIVEGCCFTDETTWLNIRTAGLVLGLGPDAVEDTLGKGATGEENRKTLTAFLRQMPIQGPWTELRVQAHLQRDRKRLPSDGTDYFAVAAVSPFVDYMVVDRKMYHLADAAGFTKRGDLTLLRRLADLRDRLEHDIDPEE